jgi:hypothetical protein
MDDDDQYHSPGDPLVIWSSSDVNERTSQLFMIMEKQQADLRRQRRDWLEDYLSKVRAMTFESSSAFQLLRGDGKKARLVVHDTRNRVMVNDNQTRVAVEKYSVSKAARLHCTSMSIKEQAVSGFVSTLPRLPRCLTGIMFGL